MKYCATCHATYSSEYKSCPIDNSVLRSTSELVQGMVIRGKYEVLDKIGSGGMAAVYRARHLAFDEIRAIKVVRSFLAEDENFVRRLRSEAIISRKLKHPNAVRVDDLDQLEDGRPFIVMEYVEGADLRKVIRDSGPLPVARVVNIAMQVASALAEAHRLGIIHRDIKPDNIILVPQPGGEEVVKVLDFGIAKLHAPSADGVAATQTGMLLCTPEYASPEQVSGGSKRIDRRSDIYSLGIVMYEMLTGEVPFHSDTPMGVLLAQINVVPKSPSEFKPELNIPQELSALLMKAVEKDPAERFQTAESMLQALAAIHPADRRDTAASSTASTQAIDTALPWPAPSQVSREPVHVEETSRPTITSELTAELEEGKRRARKRTRIGLVLAVVVVALSLAGLKWGPQVLHGGLRKHPVEVPAKSVDQLALDKVVAGLRDAHLAGAEKIRPSVRDGVVHLEGEAPDTAAVDGAAEVAAKVTGYVVDKNVRIVPPPAPQPASSPATTVSSPATTTENMPASVPVTQGSPQQNSSQQNLAAPPAPGVEPAVSGQERADLKTGPPAQKPVDPRIPPLLASAREKYENGQLDEAISDYNAVLNIDRHNREAQRGRAKAVSARDYVKKQGLAADQ